MESSGVPNVCVFEDDEPPQIEEKVLAYAALPGDPAPPSELFAQQFSAVEQTRQLAAWLDQL
jgi:hypothetical protein